MTFALILVFFSGCGSDGSDAARRTPITLDSFAVMVKEGDRGYMLSDKKGGFLTGTLAPRSGSGDIVWTIGGRTFVRGVDLTIGGEGAMHLDSAMVRADYVTIFFRGGTTEQVMPVEFPGVDVHAFALRIRPPRRSEVRVLLSTSQTSVSMYASPAGAPTTRALALPATDEATVIVLNIPAGEALAQCAALAPAVDSLMRLRSERIERMLNLTFLRTSDDRLNRALSWRKSSVDALVIEGRDTLAVPGLPWDGSLQCRENVESVAEIGRTTGDFAAAAAICRNLLRWQDTVRGHTTFGRLAREVVNGSPVYDAADVGPLFAREAYDLIVSSDDTSFIQGLYAFTRAGIDGTRKYHADKDNLLVHGENETWMRTVPRGNRAAEVEQFWYFEQMIGAYLASHLGDRALAREWGRLATQTAASFQEMFTDTSRDLVYDHLQPDGSGSPEVRPNPLLCLELLGSELVQQETIKETVGKLVYPFGVGTLASDDRRFRAAGDRSAKSGWEYNGPAWTWLAGQFTYALTRYDRQDFSFQLTEAMAKSALAEGIVGTIPEMYAAVPSDGAAGPSGEGRQASLTGMTQFLSSWEQNYLGVRVDATANLLSLEPKLPPGITSAEFTIMMGSHSISGAITRQENLTRITLFAPDLARDLDCSILWVLDDGDAWKIAAGLPRGVRLNMALGPDDVAASLGDKRTDLKEVRRLSKFSLKGVFSGVKFANAGN